METIARGNAGEAAVLNAFIQRDFEVLVPFGSGHPYDLVADLGDIFLRVQCKTGWRSRGCLLFNAYATDHGHGPASYAGRADMFGVHFPETDAIYLVPVTEIPQGGGRLRLDPTLNNQRRRVRLACDYEIDRWRVERLRQVVAKPELTLAA